MSTAFAIRYAHRFAWLFQLSGLGPRSSGVTVDDSSVTVRMGWAFTATIPRASIVQAQADGVPWLFGIGVHTNLRGRWVVNGAPDHIVTLEISPPAPGRALGFPIQLRRLDVSLDDPAGLLRVLARPHMPR